MCVWGGKHLLLTHFLVVGDSLFGLVLFYLFVFEVDFVAPISLDLQRFFLSRAGVIGLHHMPGRFLPSFLLLVTLKGSSLFLQQTRV